MKFYPAKLFFLPVLTIQYGFQVTFQSFFFSAELTEPIEASNTKVNFQISCQVC